MNAHSSADRHHQNLSKSFVEGGDKIRTKQSFENFRISIGKKERQFNPYSYNEGDDQVVENFKQGIAEKDYRNTKFELSNKSDNSHLKYMASNPNSSHHNLAGLKATNYYKRSGILKMNNPSYNANDISMNSNQEGISAVTSTVNLSFGEDLNDNDDNNYRTNRKHVRIVDPKHRLTEHSMSKSPLREMSRTPSTPFIQKNADNRVVPGALRKQPIDFSKVNENAKNEQSGDTQAISQIEEIDPSEVHRAEPYFEFFK